MSQPATHMHKKWQNLLSTLCLVAVMLLVPVTGWSQQEVSEEALAAINTAIAEVQNEISRRNTERASVYQTLQDNERTLADLNARIDTLQSSIADNENRLSRLEQQSDELESQKAAQQTLIKQYVRSAYQTGRQEYFKLLLNQENPAQVSRTLGYYQYFSAARTRSVNEYNETLDNIQEVEQRITATTQELGEQQLSLREQRTSLERSLTERQTLLDELDVMLSTSAQKLEALEAERQEMELLIEELRRSITNLSLGDQQQPFASLKGNLNWPVDGRLSNLWGSSYGLGDLSWEGVTISADAGSDVRAVHHGRVVFSDWFSSSGLLLIIDHGDGYMSLYAHNQALFKDVGEWVNSGETIASVGNTGGQDEFGLYFEIRHNGSSENPSAWCIARN